MSWADITRHDREMNKRYHDAEVVPCMRGHRASWIVVHRNCNFSAFNGYSYTPSDYSLVLCDPGRGGCGRRWRTKAAYVDDLPDQGSQNNQGSRNEQGSRKEQEN
jgi:hypothetical protein